MAGGEQMADPLENMINHRVVLETGTPVVFLGTLVEVTVNSYVLQDADVHDCRDGHAQKEKYLAESRQDGVTINRRNVIVMQSAVICVSRLDDIVSD